MMSQPQTFSDRFCDEARSYKQWTENIAGDLEAINPWPRSAVISESLLPNAYPMSKNEDTLAMSPTNHPEVPGPTDILPTSLMNPYSTLPTSEPITEGIPELPLSPIPVVSIQSDSSSSGSWVGTHFGTPSVMAHSFYYPTDSFQRLWENNSRLSCSPSMEGDFCSRSPSPTGLDIDVLAEAVDSNPDTYGPQLRSSHLAPRPVHKRHKCDHSAHRIGGQVTRFTCTVDHCGKQFTGKWEMDRHIKSVHRPPTIGCRRCNYKQSRKDLFSEHCKKRHPDEPIEDLMHPLSTSGA
ncbi:hypothetical protein BJV78DRAFT_1193111 [Lactifluus subvellereus]|nr:hypothetical protein BJV78DRAFT_1193111 [Lactifluus subvellereus]